MFERPTLANLIETITADMHARQGGEQFRHSDATVYSKIIAAAVHNLYGYGEYIYKQIMPDTATGGELDRIAGFYRVIRRQGTRGAGTVTLNRISSAAAQIPAGTVLATNDGLQVKTTAAITAPALPANANEDAKKISVAAITLKEGTAGNLPAGERLQLISPITHLSGTAEVKTEFTGGTNTETDESLRSRLLSRLRGHGCGGVEADYQRWVQDYPDLPISRVWVTGLQGSGGGISSNNRGQVGIRFVIDSRAEAQPPQSIVPTVDEIAKVKDHLETLIP